MICRIGCEIWVLHLSLFSSTGFVHPDILQLFTFFRIYFVINSIFSIPQTNSVWEIITRIYDKIPTMYTVTRELLCQLIHA